MSRLSQFTSNPMLREYAQGAAQSNIQPVADFIAPTVNVSSMLGRFKKYTEKHKFKIPSTRRGIGGRATELSFEASDATYDCKPHALDFPVDRLEQDEADLENLLQEGADMCAEIGGLAHEKAVIDTALAAVADTAVTFGSSDDPVDIIDGHILTVIKAARYGSAMGIRIVFGASAWKKFKNNAKVAGKFIVGQGAQAATNIPMLENVGKLFLANPELRNTFMVYDDSVEGKADDIKFMLDNVVLIFAARANANRRDPCFMKTFRPAGKWMIPGTYTRDDNRVDVAKFDWAEDIQVTNAPAAVKLVVG